MFRVIRQIEQALHQLYHFELRVPAEFFLIDVMPNEGFAIAGSKWGGQDWQGALLVYNEEQSPDEEPEISLGIYLSEGVRTHLETLEAKSPDDWSHDEVAAFLTAAEEISHFHYFIHHSHGGRAVSLLEMEVQGELDKFLLLYFVKWNALQAESVFNHIYIQLFETYSLPLWLNPDQRVRYQEASKLSQRFIRKHRAALLEQGKIPTVFHELRRFYRWGAIEKLSYLSSL